MQQICNGVRWLRVGQRAPALVGLGGCRLLPGGCRQLVSVRPSRLRLPLLCLHNEHKESEVPDGCDI